MFLAAFGALEQHFCPAIPDLIRPRIHGSTAYNSLPVTWHISIDMLRRKTPRTVISARLFGFRDGLSAFKADKCFINLFHGETIYNS